MDRLTKIKVFAECELHRASSEVCYTRDKYLLSLSAYDLAAYHSGSLPLDSVDGYHYGLCQGVLLGLLRGGAISDMEFSSCSAYLKSLRFGMLS